VGALSAVATAAAAEMPRLERRGEVTQLIVDGQPYLVLGGELHNSSSSSLAYVKPILPRLKAMNLNTVLAVVSWDLVEPEEGRFDWTLVDGLIEEARRNDLRLILLWFGSWKNGLSHYVPDWVKADYERFPRAKVRTGTLEVLSPLAPANWEADAKAYAAFMRHLRQVDGDRHTVLMIQMQNEVGLHADTRDRSGLADAAFKEPVPKALMDHLVAHKETLLPEFRALWQRTGFKTSGTWTDVFGPGPKTDEIFMGWHYARYCDRLAAAGKEILPLPVFVNAWIVQPEDELPGQYPSGGPQGHMLDIWRAAASHLDLYAPDIYLPNFAEVCAEFVRNGNPLFVPESRAGVQGVANAFVAIGNYNAIGYSPFGIDSRLQDAENSPIAQAYGLLETVAPLILEHQAAGTIRGVSLTRENQSARVEMGDYILTPALVTSRRDPSDVPERAYGIMMQTGPDEFVVLGGSLQVTFASRTSPDETVGLATVEEGAYQHGQWVPGRTLNGDAIMISYDMEMQAASNQTGTALRFNEPEPSILRAKLYRFK
jgi:beta-galactosidase GanA